MIKYTTMYPVNRIGTIIMTYHAFPSFPRRIGGAAGFNAGPDLLTRLDKKGKLPEKEVATS